MVSVRLANTIETRSSLLSLASMTDSSFDPSLLEGLSETERREALRTAEAARRAEERAEQKALERALRRKEEERQLERQEAAAAAQAEMQTLQQAAAVAGGAQRLTFVSKRKRQEQKDTNRREIKTAVVAPSSTSTKASTGISTKAPRPSVAQPPDRRLSEWTEREFSAVKKAYLGKSAVAAEQEDSEAQKKKRRTKKIIFKFRWEDNEDTFAKEEDPLYSSQVTNALAVTASTRRPKSSKLAQQATTVRSVQNKLLRQMTPRDWRIFRENYEISVKGGQAPPPMRSFRESPAPELIPSLHPALLDAIENVLRFKAPSPIQRQAIPIGLQRRDLIGIAETGSGKTVAFGVPLCHYLLQLPTHVLQSVAAEGPLALVMAPTRELALQIHGELDKLLSRQNQLQTAAIVGGQPIQNQAMVLRKGVHIVVGTPGRINECIEMAYCVLNQCCYIVMDEADRMIDMGFAPQMESILDAMGGSIKSENEEETYQQELEDLKQGGVARHRLTAMFSATMPLEVERIAKQYLRHPAIVSIGDQDSGKNSRITQKIIFLSSPGQKEKALRDRLSDSRFFREKVLVFVNEKRHADQVGRLVERIGRPCVVLHGGKSQEQREENLEKFRRGGVVMVATDVAGRGLDIPDVAHVINYDLPTRSIENYTHRIGRTGRAGKTGLATSFITDEDEGIMAPLKAYLESTGNEVPDRLSRHPAASATAQNNLIY
jgi:ATP-dependent RNA helicase DDX23/PRP28